MPPGSRCQLPPELADALQPTLRAVLDHSVRRCLLRTLNMKLGPRTMREMAMTMPGTPRGVIEYHVHVLTRSGSFSVTGWREDGEHGRALLYDSNIADVPHVNEILAAVQPCDASGPGPEVRYHGGQPGGRP